MAKKVDDEDPKIAYFHGGLWQTDVMSAKARPIKNQMPPPKIPIGSWVMFMDRVCYPDPQVGRVTYAVKRHGKVTYHVKLGGAGHDVNKDNYICQMIKKKSQKK